MGRKSTTKKRIDDQQKKFEWAAKLIPAFQENGLKKFSMDEAAAYLQISKATLYKYFSSRQEILEYMIAWKLEQLSGTIENLQDKSNSFLDRFLSSHQLTVQELSGISSLFLSDLKSMYPVIWQQVDSFMDRVIKMLEDFYREGIANGELNDIHPGVLILTDQLFIKSLGDRELLAAHNLEPSEAIEAFFLMKFGGIFKKEFLQDDGYSNKIRSFLDELASR